MRQVLIDLNMWCEVILPRNKVRVKLLGGTFTELCLMSIHVPTSMPKYAYIDVLLNSQIQRHIFKHTWKKYELRHRICTFESI